MTHKGADMTDTLRERLEELCLLATQGGDPIREPRRSHIARYYCALSEAWLKGDLVTAAPSVPDDAAELIRDLRAKIADMDKTLTAAMQIASMELRETAAQPAPDAVAEAVTPDEVSQAIQSPESGICTLFTWVDDGHDDDGDLTVDGPVNVIALANWINARIAKGTRT